MEAASKGTENERGDSEVSLPVKPFRGLIYEQQARIEELEADCGRYDQANSELGAALVEARVLLGEATAILKVCAPEMDWPTLHEFLAKLEETE